jgi:hypothetical protein
MRLAYPWEEWRNADSEFRGDDIQAWKREGNKNSRLILISFHSD